MKLKILTIEQFNRLCSDCGLEPISAHELHNNEVITRAGIGNYYPRIETLEYKNDQLFAPQEVK